MEYTLREKILQMFITGFYGTDYKSNPYFSELIRSGLGGVIFFTHNIESAEGIKNIVSEIKSESKIPPFFSIDQEGGRVERTENIYNGKKYLSAEYAYKNGKEYLRNQTRQIAGELRNFGINMNFAPVLDVNTNDKNPIIGERAFSNDCDEVIDGGKIVFEEYEKNGIITVGKHFPGHGEASADSHKTLPVIDISRDELENIHIKPFKELIKEGLPVIMAAHVLYPELDKDNPASVSEKIIGGVLIREIGFNGVIITDDMEMNGIKGMSRFEACKRAINAGVTMFIFRNTDEEIVRLIDDTEKAVKSGEISEEKINSAFKKITDLKYRYGLI